MEYKILPFKVVNSNSIQRIRVATPSTCPICHKAVVPQEQSCHLTERLSETLLYVVYLCPGCKKLFVTLHKKSDIYDHIHMIANFPFTPKETAFSETIKKISPKFIKIFTQSEIAEQNSLDMIAGCGFRKSIEFLVKDYLIYLNPQKEENIKNEFLGASIKKLENPKIQTLAEKATWIGNDETHYVSKHDNLNINDMKNFIIILCNYIEMEETYKKALIIENI